MDQDRLRLRDLFNLSGALTLARVPLAFVTAFVIHDRALLLVVLAAAMLTDVLDGPVARWRGTVSRAGAVADGWADKIFLINFGWSALMEGYVEPWHLWVFFLREIVQALTIPFVALSYAKKKAPDPRPHPAGKVCTVAIALAFVAGLMSSWAIRDGLTVVAGVTGLWCAIHYVRRDRFWRRWTGNAE